jgi:hypothetical protein
MRCLLCDGPCLCCYDGGMVDDEDDIDELVGQAS